MFQQFQPLAVQTLALAPVAILGALPEYASEMKVSVMDCQDEY